MELQEEAVLARDPAALDDLGRLSRELPDPLELAGGRRDADDRGQRVPAQTALTT